MDLVLQLYMNPSPQSAVKFIISLSNFGANILIQYTTHNDFIITTIFFKEILIIHTSVLAELCFEI